MMSKLPYMLWSHSPCRMKYTLRCPAIRFRSSVAHAALADATCGQEAGGRVATQKGRERGPRNKSWRYCVSFRRHNPQGGDAKGRERGATQQIMAVLRQIPSPQPPQCSAVEPLVAKPRCGEQRTHSEATRNSTAAAREGRENLGAGGNDANKWEMVRTPGERGTPTFSSAQCDQSIVSGSISVMAPRCCRLRPQVRFAELKGL